MMIVDPKTHHIPALASRLKHPPAFPMTLPLCDASRTCRELGDGVKDPEQRTGQLRCLREYIIAYPSTYEQVGMLIPSRSSKATCASSARRYMTKRGHSPRTRAFDSDDDFWAMTRTRLLALSWRGCTNMAPRCAASSDAPVWTSSKVNVLSRNQSLYSWNNPTTEHKQAAA